MCDVDRLEQNNTIPDEYELVLIAVNVYVPYTIDGNMLYKPKRIGKYVNNAVHKIGLLLISDNDNANDNDDDNDN